MNMQKINRISDTFNKLKIAGRKGFIAYVTGGDPDIDTTHELVLAIEQAGADIIEIGVPFSDPMADGPVIQLASERALAAGTSLRKIIALVEDLRKQTQVPLVLMSYYNPILRYGLAQFAANAAAAGVDGVIIPDLPFEEAATLQVVLDKKDIFLIPLVAPTSTAERLEHGLRSVQGFVYCVAVNGTTGGISANSNDVARYCAQVAMHTKIPLAIGFGISNKEQAAKMSEYADAVIVGSAIVKIIEQYHNDKALMLNKVAEFVREIHAAI